jgi:small GTP-binding protein
MSLLASPNVELSPDKILEKYIVATATRAEPIPIDSPDGKRLYRALALHIWNQFQRPVIASDIRDLWEKIDSIKRGGSVGYGLTGIHFWAAEFANALASETIALDPAAQDRLSAWLDKWPNVCILGHTGRGKSSTINRLFGIKMAEIGHHRSTTDTVSDYRLITGNFMGRPTGVVLWDVPGYGDDRMPFERSVKLYRRMARRCDVVIFMLDNDRSAQLDLKMFQKLNKRVPSLHKKLVVAINKADLFHPFNWDETAGAPSERMLDTIQQRVFAVGELLELGDINRVVPISALRNWNIFALLSAMVDAAGATKGASLLKAAHPDDSGTEGGGEDSSGADEGKRFGINRSLRKHFRAMVER